MSQRCNVETKLGQEFCAVWPPFLLLLVQWELSRKFHLIHQKLIFFKISNFFKKSGTFRYLLIEYQNDSNELNLYISPSDLRASRKKWLRTSFNLSGNKCSNCESSFFSIRYCRSKFDGLLFAFPVLGAMLLALLSRILLVCEANRLDALSITREVPRGNV